MIIIITIIIIMDNHQYHQEWIHQKKKEKQDKEIMKEDILYNLLMDDKYSIVKMMKIFLTLYKI